jgi:hypothetical protein
MSRHSRLNPKDVEHNLSSKYYLASDRRECAHCGQIKLNQEYSFYDTRRSTVCKSCKCAYAKLKKESNATKV